LGLGQALAWLSWLFLSYIIKVVELLSKVPWASIQIGKIHWLALAAIYLMVMGFILQQNKKFKLIN